MTPQEKANEFINKYTNLKISVYGCSEGSNPCIVTAEMFTKCAIDCAIIAVDEIIEMKIIRKDDVLSDYWQEVKQELIKLKNL